MIQDVAIAILEDFHLVPSYDVPQPERQRSPKGLSDPVSGVFAEHGIPWEMPSRWP